MPLCDIREQPSFYEGDGQGGYHRSLISQLFKAPREILEHFENRGLEFKLSAQDIHDLIRSNDIETLEYIFARFDVPKEVLVQIQNRQN